MKCSTTLQLTCISVLGFATALRSDYRLLASFIICITELSTLQQDGCSSIFPNFE